MNLSKLQSEAVALFRKDFAKEYPDGSIRWLRGIWIEDIETLIQDQIQKAYSKGREEVIKEKDIAEKFLYSNLPLDLSIGTEFEVGGRYEDWGFVVNYKGNKISEGGNLEQAINNAKIKLSIQSKENKMKQNKHQEKENVVPMANYFNHISPQDLEEIMEWLEDNDYLSNEGRLFKTQFWKLFIRQTK